MSELIDRFRNWFLAKEAPPNTKESVHPTYYLAKGTLVLLTEETAKIGTIKEHNLTKNMSFTENEFVEYKDGWYTFLRDGWWLKVKRIYVAKDDLTQLF